MSNESEDQNRLVSFEDRRKGADLAAILQLCKTMHDSQVALGNAQNELSAKLDAHLTEEPAALAKEIAALMLKAFPEGDPDGHRRHHELVIKQAEARAEFWSMMQKELAKYGLVGFVCWAGYYLWKAALLGPR